VSGRYALATLVAAGIVLVVPVAGHAETATPAPPPPITVQPPARYPFVAVSPSWLVSGDTALISIGCQADKVHDVTSKVLDIGPFETTSDGPSPIQGAVATIRKGIKPSFYSLTAFCDKAKLLINFEVHAPKPGPDPTPTKPRPTPTNSPVTPSSTPKATGHQVSRVPVGAPQTGGGGTATGRVQ
jgi:hypothetical protein